MGAAAAHTGVAFPPGSLSRRCVSGDRRARWQPLSQGVPRGDHLGRRPMGLPRTVRFLQDKCVTLLSVTCT